MTRKKTTNIVVHHTVTPQDHDKLGTIARIRSAHKKNGLAYDGNPAYHFIIGHNWTVATRDIKTIGYHAGNWEINKVSVAVALVGNFNNDHLTQYQEDELGRILRHWMKEFNIARKNILLHKEIKATACPGANITQGLIDMVVSSKENDMITALKARIVEFTAQVKRLHIEVKKLTGEVVAGKGREMDKDTQIIVLANQVEATREEVKRKEEVIVAKEKELLELRGSLDDAEQTAEENDDRIREEAADEATEELKQNILGNFWDWLTGKR